MGLDHVGLDPDAVTVAGHRTAGTAGEWSAWASRVETLLRSAATSANDTTVTSAIEDRLSTLNPKLHGLAGNAEALGGNAVAASHVIVNADGQSTTELGVLVDSGQGTRTHLNRSITPI